MAEEVRETSKVCVLVVVLLAAPLQASYRTNQDQRKSGVPFCGWKPTTTIQVAAIPHEFKLNGCPFTAPMK